MKLLLWIETNEIILFVTGEPWTSFCALRDYL